MSAKTIFSLLAYFICHLALSQDPKKLELVSLKNGNKLYYEVYGQGEPLFLLHGYTVSSKSWLPFVNDYAKTYEVYLVDLQGHGKSGSFKTDLSIKAAAGEVDELVQYLNLKTITGIGWSYGGDVLFQLASSRPGLVKSMISIGACGFWDAKLFPTWIEELSYKNIQNLTYMSEHQASQEQSKSILDQLPNYQTSLTDDDMSKITSSVMIVLGDQDDGVPLDYLARTRKNLPKSYIWILPNTGHGAQFGRNKQDFVKTSLAFLKGDWDKK